MRRGHERGRLLMSGQNKVDRRFSQGFDKIEILFARDAEDAIDAFVFEGGDKQVGAFQHMLSPMGWSRVLVRVHARAQDLSSILRASRACESVFR
jgi:hypothetical protein